MGTIGSFCKFDEELDGTALVALVKTDSATTDVEPEAAAGTTGFTRLQNGFAKAVEGLDKTGVAPKPEGEGAPKQELPPPTGLKDVACPAPNPEAPKEPLPNDVAPKVLLAGAAAKPAALPAGAAANPTAWGAKGVAEGATTELGTGKAADVANDDPTGIREGIGTVLDNITDLPVQISNTGAALDD